ncbi:MAG: hypothetical protein ACYC61_03295 [Isosphaeraceae bacterium]
MPSRSNSPRLGRPYAIVILVVMAGLAGAAIGQATATRAPEKQPAGDPLVALNDAFRSVYRRTKQETLAHGGPVILGVGDHLVLRRAGTRTEVPYTPAVYHVLKGVAHVPLALDVLLAPHAETAALDDGVLAEMRDLRRLMEAAEPSLANHGMDAEQLDRARRIYAESRAFLDAVIQAKHCTRDERIAFARRMHPLVMKNVGEAARAELDALHARVTAWRKEMSPDEWKRLKVVILGSALPRQQSLTVQYFARLLGEPGEGPRIIYAESIRDEDQALDLMATRAVDTGIGVDFFNDPTRMQRDLLCDAARDYLPLLIDRP